MSSQLNVNIVEETHPSLTLRDEFLIHVRWDLKPSSFRLLCDEHVPLLEQDVPEGMQIGERLVPQFLRLPRPA